MESCNIVVYLEWSSIPCAVNATKQFPGTTTKLAGDILYLLLTGDGKFEVAFFKKNSTKAIFCTP